MKRLKSSYTLLPSVVKALLISNGFMFVLERLDDHGLLSELALWPLNYSGNTYVDFAQSHFQVFQLITYGFLHGSGMHLFLNMYALWLFGSRMENVWGSRKFAMYYFVCLVGAGLVQLLVSTLSGDYYPTIGASGAVFGLLLAFGMRFPNEILLLIFPPIPMKAKWFVMIFAGIELWAGIAGTEAGVAHFAHLGGMLFGYLLISYWKVYPPRFR